MNDIHHNALQEPLSEESPSRQQDGERNREADDLPSHVVGIGASAGGLESLERLFVGMPTDTGMAFVVIQHLSPNFKSMVDELLTRRTRVPVRIARHGESVQANHIYLLPPKKEMIIEQGRLWLTDKDGGSELTLPIDRFLRSLARDCKTRSVAVILSGTGSDGSRGLVEVKAAEGLVLCENEFSAKFNGMPLSAQQTGMVDLVVRAEEIPEVLVRHKRGEEQGWLDKPFSPFEPLDERCKIYQKARDVRLAAHDPGFSLPVHGQARSAAIREAADGGGRGLLDLYDTLLDRFMPPGLLVDSRRELVDSFAGAQQLLSVPARRPSNDVLDMLDASLRPIVAGGLRRVEKEKKPVTLGGLPTVNGQPLKGLRIEPLSGTRGYQGMHFLITFEVDREVAHPPQAAPSPSGDEAMVSQSHVAALEDELRSTKENLQTIIEELETSNEELQATNEELVAANEELQRTNEELNSVNEELYTVNSEYQKKIAELKELNEDMNHLLESTEIGTLFLDRQLRIRRFTPRVADIFDLVDQDVGRRITSFSYKLDCDDLMEQLQQVVDQATSVERELRDGQGNCLLLRILPYRHEGMVDGAVLTFTDVTVLDKARTSLRRLSAIVESSDDAIISSDLDGRVLSWNRGAQQLYGYTPEEALCRDIRDLIAAPDKRAQMNDSLSRVAAGESVFRPETLRRCKDDSLVEVSVSASPVRDNDGRPMGVATITRDIRAYKTVERALRESERKYQDLYNHAPDLYASIDTRNGLVLECNNTLLAELGYRRDEVVDQPVFMLYVPSCQEAAHRAFKTFQEHGEVHDVELTMVRKDGSSLDVSLNDSAVRDEAGAILRSRSVWRNVTERKRAEQELRAEIQRREQFLAMLSHELRNPLNALRTATAILAMDNIDTATYEKIRGLIVRQTGHMARLLDDLLDVSRITGTRWN